MLYNILKIFLIFSVASVASAASIDCKSSAAQGRNTIYEKVGERFYYFSNDTLSRLDALRKCVSLRAVLASLENPSDQNIISDYMVRNLPIDRYWWLSADVFHSKRNDWLVEGVPGKDGNWAPGQPDNKRGNEYCVYLKYSLNNLKRYEMHDSDCERRVNYICEQQKVNNGRSSSSIRNSI